jgi:hypothetical protein
MYQKPPPPDRSRTYLNFIRQQPCCLCGDDVHVEAHHPRFGVGMAERADDREAVALCGKHHRELHGMNEREFWARYNVDPQALALRYQVMVR